MRILVTGGSGFIGTNYIDFLSEKGEAEFINFDQNAPRNSAHVKFWRKGDLLEADGLKKTIKEFSPTHVVHLAAKCGTDETRLDVFAANMQGVENLLTALRGTPSVERVVFTSSTLVCRIGYVPRSDTDYQPSTPYGQSKARMEQIIRGEAAKGLPFTWTIIRPISIWGPWCEEPYRGLFKAIAQGWYFHVGSGQYRKCLGYVENTAYQIHQLLLAPLEKVHGRTLYLADGVADLYAYTSEVRQALGAKRIRRVPVGVMKVVAKVGDILKAVGWRSVPMTSFRLTNILTEHGYDLQPILDITAPLPYDLKTGVDRTVQWMRQSNGVRAEAV